jgi:hypothetical protein
VKMYSLSQNNRKIKRNWVFYSQQNKFKKIIYFFVIKTSIYLSKKLVLIGYLIIFLWPVWKDLAISILVFLCFTYLHLLWIVIILIASYLNLFHQQTKIETPRPPAPPLKNKIEPKHFAETETKLIFLFQDFPACL